MYEGFSIAGYKADAKFTIHKLIILSSWRFSTI